MSEMSLRQTLSTPFRRSPAEPYTRPDRLQFQVMLCLKLVEEFSNEDCETILTTALDTLVEEAKGVALGPVGGVDLTTGTVEIEFTVETISPAVLYAKMGEVMRVLEHAGFVYEASKEHLLPEHDLQPA
jgi:hypothetical protein